MRILKTGFLAWISLVSFTNAKAQTVDEIISGYINAIGGRDVLAKIKTMTIDATMNALGSTLPVKITMVNGKAFKTETSFNGSTIINCVTETGAWMLNPMMGQSNAQPVPEDQARTMKSSLYLGGPLVDYQSKGYSAEFVGRDTAQGNAYKIRLTDNNGADETFFIDPSTYYILKIEMKATVNRQDILSTTTLSDYRKTDLGYVMPYSTTTNTAFEFTISYNQIEFNMDIDPTIFDMPK